MANNDDQFTPQTEGEFVEEFKETSPLVEAWKNSPMLKVMVIGAAVLVVVGGVYLFGGSDEKQISSRLASNPGVTEAPGGEVDPQYEGALLAANQARVETAEKSGKSAIPSPIGPTTGIGAKNLPKQDAQAVDPLEQWRQSIEKRQKERDQKQEQQQRFTRVQQEQQRQQKIEQKNTDALAKAMADQFSAIMAARAPSPSKVTNITSQSYIEEKQAAALSALTAQSGQQQGGLNGLGQPQVVNEQIVIPAGEIEYAQLITQARSDIDAPVLAQIASGPFAGARVLGNFQRAQGNYLILSFERMVVDGIDYPITAVAIDPQTTLGGMATDVDYHWFTRVILPGAASFIEGLAEAYAQQQNTVTVSGDTVIQETPELNTTGKVATGIAEASGELSDIFTDEAKDKKDPTITVAAGTPIGILFVEPVVQEEF